MRFFKKKSDKRKVIPFCDLKCRIRGMSAPNQEEIFPTCVATAVHPDGKEVKTVMEYRTVAGEKAFQSEIKKKTTPKAKAKAKPVAEKSKPKPRRKSNDKVHQKR